MVKDLCFPVYQNSVRLCTYSISTDANKLYVHSAFQCGGDKENMKHFLTAIALHTLSCHSGIIPMSC